MFASSTIILFITIISRAINFLFCFSDLKPNTRYIFTVRSRNKEWLSRTSPFTNIITTLDKDQSTVEKTPQFTSSTFNNIRNKLEEATVRMLSADADSSTAIKVTWEVLIPQNKLEGVHVRYRPINSNRLPHIAALNEETVNFAPDTTHSSVNFFDDRVNSSSSNTGGSETKPPKSYTIRGLRPATMYEVFVVPFYGKIEGQPTISVRRTTPVAPVISVPSGLQSQLVNASTVRLSWDPLSNVMANDVKLNGFNYQVR